MNSKKNVLRRYLFRRDFLKKVNQKKNHILRKLFKDAFRDQKRIMEGHQVSIIFDVGANIGDITQKYLQLFPQATVHAFEPFPSTFAKLQTRYESNPHVITYQSALADHSGTAKLFASNANVWNSLLSPLEGKIPPCVRMSETTRL